VTLKSLNRNEFYNRGMSVLALGLNHATAPLDLRGRFAFSTEQLAPALQAFRQRVQRAPEAALVSTCNRTELYVAGEPGDMGTLIAPAVDWAASAATRCATMPTCCKAAQRRAMRSVSRPASIPWCWASPRSSVR
jgi:glutamyl-tRNA reductase